MKSQSGFSLVWLVAVVAIAGALIAGYLFYQSNSDNADTTSSSNSQETAPEEQPPTQEEEEVAGITITTGDSAFGTILFDANNQAIYIWEVEETSEAECYGDCAVAWPPVLTNGEPVASGEVNAGLLGTTTRTDGTTQVTYNGHPLYYYVDEGPGEVKCHNVFTHGGSWWVIDPSGNRVN